MWNFFVGIFLSLSLISHHLSLVCAASALWWCLVPAWLLLRGVVLYVVLIIRVSFSWALVSVSNVLFPFIYILSLHGVNLTSVVTGFFKSDRSPGPFLAAGQRCGEWAPPDRGVTVARGNVRIPGKTLISEGWFPQEMFTDAETCSKLELLDY